MTRLVFLVGAGASYGSERALPEVPPLGCGLYDSLAFEYPDIWGIGSRLGQYAVALRLDFEQAMYQTVTIENPSIDILEWHRSMARYFSRFEPTTGNLYRELLFHLSERGLTEQATVVSLNYECLIERAAVQMGIPISFELNGRPGTLHVLKPHGSCNFVFDIDGRGRQQLCNPCSVVGIGEFRTLSLDDLPSQLDRVFKPTVDSSPASFPVMSTYSVGKPSVLSGLQPHRNKWVELAGAADQIVLLGIGRANDSHLVEPVRNAPGEIFYVGGDLSHWKAINARIESLGARFQDARAELLALLDRV